MSTNEKIWILGGKASNADNSIAWQKNIPNLSNSDRLIIDFNTIPANVEVPSSEINTYLRYMLMSRKIIYVILSKEFEKNHQYPNMLPIFPRLIKIKPCKYDCINLLQAREMPDEIAEYCKYVEKCSFFIDMINSSDLWMRINPGSLYRAEKYPESQYFVSLVQENIFELLNSSSQSIVFACKYDILDSRGLVQRTTGKIVFLPPPTKISSSEAIQVLVNTLVSTTFAEDEPEWVSAVEMPKVGDLTKQISEETEKVTQINASIEKLKSEKTKIEKHKELLWTYNKHLENAVKDALHLLGFQEVREGRSKELEDLIIELETSDDYIHGVIEVKGREKKTSLADMNQCFKWVNDYRVQEDKIVKGIFVTNQFRRTETLSSEKRIKFEPNEVRFAKDYKLCILPTCELFKAVTYVLNGGELPRKEIEKKILDADPICTLVE